MTNNQVDLGVRVELPAKIFEHITDVVYESKLLYRTKQYGDTVRTFCMNPYGHVVAENVDGLITVNGHSYADPAAPLGEYQFCPAGVQSLHLPLQPALRLWKAHRVALQYAGRAASWCSGSANLIKGVRTMTTGWASFTRPDAERHPRGSEPGPAEAAYG